MCHSQLIFFRLKYTIFTFALPCESQLMTAYFSKLQDLQENAYAPYSKFQVAAILVMKNGLEFTGVNVENASFAGTLCAERSAFASAVSKMGHQGGYQALHLLGGSSDNYCMPCGICRQVIAEFVDDEFEVVVYNQNGDRRVFDINELMPHRFSDRSLD